MDEIGPTMTENVGIVTMGRPVAPIAAATSAAAFAAADISFRCKMREARAMANVIDAVYVASVVQPPPSSLKVPSKLQGGGCFDSYHRRHRPVGCR